MDPVVNNFGDMGICGIGAWSVSNAAEPLVTVYRIFNSCSKITHAGNQYWRDASTTLQNLYGFFVTRTISRCIWVIRNIYLMLANCVSKDRQN